MEMNKPIVYLNGSIVNDLEEALTFIKCNIWSGQGTKFPPVIASEEKEPFTMQRSTGMTEGPTAAVVYRRQTIDPSQQLDWLISWKVGSQGDNKVYTDIGAPGSFDDWTKIYKLLNGSTYQSHVEWSGFKGDVTIDNKIARPTLDATISVI